MRTKFSLAVIMMLTLCASVAYAGTEGYEYVRSEPLTMLDIDVADVAYDFTGNATVPFTLSGSQANIYLAIYTKDQATPGGWGGPGHEAWNGGHALNRKAGIPNMVKVVECGRYEVGPGTCVWDGLDWDGEPVEPGTYTLYVLGVNNIDDGNWVGVVGHGAGFRLRGATTVNMQGEGWFMGVGSRLGITEGGPRWHLNERGADIGSVMFYPIAAGNFLQDDWFSLLRICELPEYGLTDDEGNPTYPMYAHGAAVDPNDLSRWWMYAYPGGVVGLTVSEDLTSSVPMEGFRRQIGAF